MTKEHLEEECGERNGDGRIQVQMQGDKVATQDSWVETCDI